jgi:hypothetical protein
MGTLSSDIPAGQPLKLDNEIRLDVQNLDPGESVTFTYTLAAPCNGHVVRAEVSAAENYERVKEKDTNNNLVQREACPRIQAPSPGGSAIEMTRPKMDPDDVMVPAHLRKGSQRWDPPVSANYYVFHEWKNPPVVRLGLCTRGSVSGPFRVGYSHHHSDGCYSAVAVQTAIQFNLDDLRTVSLVLKTATLQFEERFLEQRKSDGAPESLFRGYVRYIGLPTIDPAKARDLYPHEHEEDLQTEGARSLDVRSQVQRLLYYPVQDFGFMFGGFNEGNAEDEAACLSELWKFRLTLDYDVLGPRQ